ncbi:MAG: hypothetical protein AAFR28_14435, partial [Pseudomonadota bacterium]
MRTILILMLVFLLTGVRADPDFGALRIAPSAAVAAVAADGAQAARDVVIERQERAFIGVDDRGRCAVDRAARQVL